MECGYLKRNNPIPRPRVGLMPICPGRRKGIFVLSRHNSY